MKRASCNLGLNGLTEFSFAIWVKIFGDTGTTQRLMAKEVLAAGAAAPSRLNWDPGEMTIGAQNQTAVQTPDWVFNTPGFNSATRILFTFKRNAITSADGIMYYNGVVQPLMRFTANGYTGAFTLQEDSNNLYYGIRQNTLINPVNGIMAWPTWWNRQLTPAEVATDYADPLAVTSGRVSCVQFCPDDDLSLGGSMVVNGSLACAQLPPDILVAGDDDTGDSFQFVGAL